VLAEVEPISTSAAAVAQQPVRLSPAWRLNIRYLAPALNESELAITIPLVFVLPAIAICGVLGQGSGLCSMPGEERALKNYHSIEPRPLSSILTSAKAKLARRNPDRKLRAILLVCRGTGF
jgi:hypothetical protein